MTTYAEKVFIINELKETATLDNFDIINVSILLCDAEMGFNDFKRHGGDEDCDLTHLQRFTPHTEFLEALISAHNIVLKNQTLVV